MDALTLHVSEIPVEGVTIDCDVGAERLGLAPGDAEARGSLGVHADVLVAGQDVSVTGVVSGRFVRQCVRCLRAFEDPCEVPFSVDYRCRRSPGRRPPRPGGAVDAEPPEEATDAALENESYSYTGDELDLGPMLREQVILANPMQPLCRVDCLGLCPVCGEDRNVVHCGCPEERGPSPFAVLRDLMRKDRSWPDGSS